MKNQKYHSILIICLIVLPLSSNLSMSKKSDEVNLVFSIILLSPIDSPARCRLWPMIMQQTFFKIGIGIDFHEATSWEEIGPRTWCPPLIDWWPLVRTFAEGGYDIFFNHFYWNLDPDISDRFGGDGLIPYGNNFYQYYNPAYEVKQMQYLVELNQTLKTHYFHELQSILFEDLPAISVLYGRTLYGRRDSITGIDWDLLYDTTHRPELWNDTEDQVIVYAIPGDLKAQNIFLLKQYPRDPRDPRDPREPKIGYPDAQWMNAVYGRLFQRNQTTHYWEPEIALNYSVSSDLLNYTVNIDPNAKFSDGSLVLAEDIEYTYELHLNPNVSSTRYDELRYWFEFNQSIETIDSHKLNFNFSRFCYSPLSVLSEGILDKSEVEPLIASYGYSIFTEPPLAGNVTDSLVKSCGPFRLELYEPLNNNTVKMIPNLYWNNLTSSGGKDPLLKELYHTSIPGKDNAVAEMEAGLIDILDCLYYSVQADYKEKLHMDYVLAKTGYQADMSINMYHPIMGTGELTPVGTKDAAKSIRKAISHAVPRELIVSEIFDGLAALGTSPIADSCVGYNESMEPYVYDLELAIDYIEEAGYEVRITTPPTTTSFTIFLTMVIGLSIIISIEKRIRKRKR